MDTDKLHSALRDAIAKVDNNQSRFAEAIGTSQQLVSYWLKNKRPLPAEFVLPAERAGFGSRHVLRPDLYPIEDASTSSSITVEPRAGGPFPARSGGKIEQAAA